MQTSAKRNKSKASLRVLVRASGFFKVSITTSTIASKRDANCIYTLFSKNNGLIGSLALESGYLLADFLGSGTEFTKTNLYWDPVPDWVFV